MQVGFVGLGRMGANMAKRLLIGGHRIVAYNRTAEKTRAIMRKGAAGAFSLPELVKKLQKPRVVWVMVPAGAATETMVTGLANIMEPGDIIVDGGNSKFSDSVRRAAALEPKGIGFIDAGTSGGVWGLKNGYCMMVGGKPADVARLASVLKTLAPPDGWLHCGPVGSGHFTKMVHNGVEYAMMQAYAEGFEIMRASGFNLNLGKVAKLWNQGSVVRSWLLELVQRALEKDPQLDRIAGYVEDSGEGRWTIQQAIDTNVPAPTITMSLFARFASRQDESFAAKVLAALRREFGGHAVKDKK